MAQNDALLKTSPQQHIAQRKKERKPSSEILQFPSNLGAHATLMRFFQYSYGGVKGSVEQPLAEVLLPLPKQIQDSFKINVAGDELGITGAGAAQVAGAIGGGESSLGDSIKKLGSASVQAVENVGSGIAKAALGDFSAVQEGLAQTADAAGFLTRAGLSAVAPDIANGIGAGRGTAVNPFQTLVFKGVDLKVHSLEWLLSPETEQESRDLKAIIRTLQRMVLPKTQNPMGDGTEFGLTAIDRGILKYPAMCNIYLQGLDQNYYFKFKTSMISQLNIDYTPNGIAIQKGGKPSAIRITMTLNEAFIHTADDNSQEDLDQEFIDEGILNDDEDSDVTTLLNPTNTYEANQDFTGVEAEDEVVITTTLDDGTTVSNTLQANELNSQGITNAQIDAGEIPGKANVRLRRGTRGSRSRVV